MWIPFDLLRHRFADHPITTFYEDKYNLRTLYDGEIAENKVTWKASEEHHCYVLLN
jgi:hypothetical protein